MEIKTSFIPVPYSEAMTIMEARVTRIIAKTAGDLLWLLEHPCVYTAGTSAKKEELLESRFPVYATGRGGRYTYHGPGQRVAYIMRDLRGEPLDLHAYVKDLETWVIETLKDIDVETNRREGHIGLWTPQEQKIASIGIRVRSGVAYHGVAINVDPDLTHFEGIIPCGLRGYGVTSVAQILGRPLRVDFCDMALKIRSFSLFQKQQMLG